MRIKLHSGCSKNLKIYWLIKQHLPKGKVNFFVCLYGKRGRISFQPIEVQIMSRKTLSEKYKIPGKILELANLSMFF